MLNLLKVDFRRVLKDKLFLAICIIAVVFAIITPLLYVLIFAGLSGDFSDTEAMLELMGVSVTAKSQFFMSFSLGNNLGLILPVLLAIVMWKDFSQGTVRNKIISGNSRTSIFSSMTVTSFSVLFGIMVLSALITLLFSLIFFPYQNGDVTASDIGYFFLSLLLELLLYIFVASLISFLCATMKNLGLVIVSYIAIVMVMSIVTSVLSVIGVLLATGVVENGESAARVIEFIQKLNVFNYGTLIGAGDSYEVDELLCFILSPTLLSAALLVLGALGFKRKDLK